jgi:hypothetical protein
LGEEIEEVLVVHDTIYKACFDRISGTEGTSCYGVDVGLYFLAEGFLLFACQSLEGVEEVGFCAFGSGDMSVTSLSVEEGKERLSLEGPLANKSACIGKFERHTAKSSRFSRVFAFQAESVYADMALL